MQCSEQGCESEAVATCRDCGADRCREHHMRPSLPLRFAMDKSTEEGVCRPPCEATIGKQKYRPLPARIENDFTYHAPKDDQAERYERMRSRAKELAHLILELVPVSREQSLALTELETAIFWANAGIARNE